ncbi:hypothetical protein BSKO_06390 [Bryopsis sp. KO-2023]|nr:hypothetical protein BSKO_06390 [Bryopsis sp. KO-2023]
MTNAIEEALEAKIPGFKARIGGEELKRASAALLGVSPAAEDGESDGNDALGSPFTGTLSWLSLDFEPDPLIKELLYSTRRYAALSRRKPSDLEAVYNYGLILQEIASRLKLDVEMGRREVENERIVEILALACCKYEKSVAIQEDFQPALYNWGVALMELSGLVKVTNPAQALCYLHEASQKYAKSLGAVPSNPQALNNWGLVLQEVSSFHHDLSTKLRLAVKAIDKFRRAIRLRPDFDHGCYNLGTIFYSHACILRTQLQKSQPNEYQSSEGALLPIFSLLVGGEKATSEAVDIMMRTAAQYIVLAYALQPAKEVYQQSLRVVQNMHTLPKPYLAAGYLKAPSLSTRNDTSKTWEKLLFVLDHTIMRSNPSTQHAGRGGVQETTETSNETYNIPLSDIVSAVRCVELSLPEGEAFWLQTKTTPQGIYFVAEDKESADCWVDALTLCHHIHTQNRSNVLGVALGATPPKK